MAEDPKQAMLAIGTESGTIKIISLKGYEQELYRAHNVQINHLVFVPNQGKLLSLDIKNVLKVWDLSDLEKEAVTV